MITFSAVFAFISLTAVVSQKIRPNTVIVPRKVVYDAEENFYFNNYGNNAIFVWNDASLTLATVLEACEVRSL